VLGAGLTLLLLPVSQGNAWGWGRRRPPGVTGYGFGASVLEASVVYLLPGGIAGLLIQLSVTVTYAALPTLVVQAVHEDETGVANAVNSIARLVGQALGSTVAVTLIAAGFDPATGFPRESAFRQVSLIGVLATPAVMVVAVVGLLADRPGGTGRRAGPLTDVEEATAGAGEWSPVSGIR
jgi:hypothetical protein